MSLDGVDSEAPKNIYKRLRLIALRLKEASDNTHNELADVFSDLRVLNDALDGHTDPMVSLLLMKNTVVAEFGVVYTHGSVVYTH